MAWGATGTVSSSLTGVIGIAAGGVTLALVAGAPALVVQTSGEGLSLSWPLGVQGFALQATPDLADETSWTPVLTVPVAAGSQHRVTEPVTGPTKLYRLKK